ncbi:cell surface protein [Minicystis rosea]|nr:cell surface protein [Minicystis rosea]
MTIGVAGADVTHYRFAVDDAAWSDEQPVATPISIPSIAPGKRTLKIIGRDSAGNWQATPTTASFHMATVGTEPTTCKLVADGGTCDFLLKAPGGYYATAGHFYDANNDGVPDFEKLLDIKPGSRVCLQAGAYDTLDLRGFEGSAEAPVTIVNCGGRVDFAHSHANAALGVFDSRYLRIVGVGDAAEPYGITVATSGNQGANAIELTEGSSDYEVAFVEIKSAAYAGIAARTDVSCTWNRDTFAQENTFIHHDYLHDTAGEGLYIGGSHWGALEAVAGGAQCGANQGNGTIKCGNDCKFEAELHGVRVYANRVEDTGADGIQVGSAFSDISAAAAWDTEIYDNDIINGAVGSSPYNSGGLDINPGTSGRVYRNFVKNTDAFAGLFVAGPGHLDIFNNVVVVGTQVGLAIQDNNVGERNGPFRVLNNTIINDGGTYGIYMYHEHSTGNLCENNFILGATTTIRLNSPKVDWTESHDVTTGSLASHFVKPGSDDYHLLSTSAAVDAGADVSSYGVTTDFDKLPRNVGAYDVGAFEYHP